VYKRDLKHNLVYLLYFCPMAGTEAKERCKTNKEGNGFIRKGHGNAVKATSSKIGK